MLGRTLTKVIRSTYCTSFIHQTPLRPLGSACQLKLSPLFIPQVGSCRYLKLTRKPVVIERRGKLKTMKLDTVEFRQLFTPELKRLQELFKQYDHEIRIAGGAVRDLLSGKVPHDVDFATTATPEQMKDMFGREGIRMLHMKGEEHGTITCRINDKENFEVTTLRIDVVTDGRHAEVEFTKDWQLDANRRDLTVNSMFLGLDGTLYDYFNGKEDLEQRRVRFVGDTTSRVQEDYLRILRYFRFYGRIAVDCNAHEAGTLEAIRQNGSGLGNISGERIWTELKKIVVGNHANSLVRTMADVGLSEYLGLPAQPDVDEFDKVWHRSRDLEPQPMTMISALLKDENEVVNLNKRLRMSNEEAKIVFLILAERDNHQAGDTLKYFQDMLLDCKEGKPKMRDRILEQFKYWGESSLVEQFRDWEMPVFPVRGFDLLDKEVPKGPAFQFVLQGLRDVWKKSGYKASKEEILLHINDLIEEANEKFKKKTKKK